jgi:hypothetical protein
MNIPKFAFGIRAWWIRPLPNAKGSITEAGMKNNLLNAFMNLDGVAAANVAEPSPGDLARVLKENGRLREAIQKCVVHWFNKNDPNDPYRGCACMGCDMGDSGRKTDERGHDTDCVMSILGYALKPQLQEESE